MVLSYSISHLPAVTWTRRLPPHVPTTAVRVSTVLYLLSFPTTMSCIFKTVAKESPFFLPSGIYVRRMYKATNTFTLVVVGFSPIWIFQDDLIEDYYLPKLFLQVKSHSQVLGLGCRHIFRRDIIEPTAFT